MIRIQKKRSGPKKGRTTITSTCRVWLHCSNGCPSWWCEGSVARQRCPACGTLYSGFSMEPRKGHGGLNDT